MTAEGVPDAQRVLTTARGVLGVLILVVAASTAIACTAALRMCGLTSSPDTRSPDE